jgi:protein arginine N-methyltransferase 1
VSSGFKTKALEALLARLIRAKRLIVSNPSLGRAMRAVQRWNAFDTIYSHEEMLADAVRMDAYHAAIERYVTAQDHVVDIGTGTGVLAFFAAAENPRKVYALDRSREMLDYARTTAEANGIDNVTFVAATSRNFHPPERLDVIVQEQMGIMLFEEGMVETILEVRDRCLRPGGRILPGKFEFYLEPVELLKQERVPFIQEERVQGLKFPRPESEQGKSYYFREIRPGDVKSLLCEPAPVFAFDLATLTLDELPQRFSVSKPIMRKGQLDGICMYFRAIFDDDISFSTGPGAVKTHWRMLLYRTPQRICHAGEIFAMRVEVPDLTEHLSWSWEIDFQKGVSPPRNEGHSGRHTQEATSI